MNAQPYAEELRGTHLLATPEHGERLCHGHSEDDATDRAAGMEKVRPFNKSNPEVAIFSESIRALLKSRARYSACDRPQSKSHRCWVSLRDLCLPEVGEATSH